MAKAKKKASKPKVKSNKKIKLTRKPAPRKAAAKAPAKKSVKITAGAKKKMKKMSVTKNGKQTPNKNNNGNLRPMQITANDNDVVANAKVRYSAKDLEMLRKVIMEQRAEASEEFDIISQQLMDTSGEFE